MLEFVKKASSRSPQVYAFVVLLSNALHSSRKSCPLLHPVDLFFLVFAVALDNSCHHDRNRDIAILPRLPPYIFICVLIRFFMRWNHVLRHQSKRSWIEITLSKRYHTTTTESKVDGARSTADYSNIGTCYEYLCVCKICMELITVEGLWTRS